jgi:hypothetical protein
MPVPQRINFLWGGQEIPPIKALLRMVQHLSYNQNSLGRINTKETGFFTDSAGCNASSRKKTRFLDPMRPELILRKFCIES